MRNSHGQKIAIRVDASSQIGSGHAFRCLALADALSRRGVKPIFICGEIPKEYDSLIQKRGYQLYIFSLSKSDWQEDAAATEEILKGQGIVDWLIVDNYSLDSRWERQMRPRGRRIMVVDDLANRPHDCDLIVDQNFGTEAANYKELVPRNCHGLFGPKFALLRKEFADERRESSTASVPDGEVVHVFFGTADLTNYTGRFSRLLANHFLKLKLEVVTGNFFRDSEELVLLGKTFNSRVNWHNNLDNMIPIMRRCSIAFGAPGITTWERACMGLPAAYLAVNKNQKRKLTRLEKMGLCAYLGAAEDISDEDFVGKFSGFIADEKKRMDMRKLSLSLVDGLGADRVASFLLT